MSEAPKKEIAFSQVKLILKKPEKEREPTDIANLKLYFKENNFFKKYGQENGENWLNQIYTKIKYESVNKDKYIMRYGEFGSTYYIVLKGKVQVR